MDQEGLQQIEIDLRSTNILQRKKALDKLATIEASLAVPILTKLAEEKDFGLRCMAVMGLSNHLTDDSFNFLVQVLEQEKDNSVLAEAANSIYDFGERALVPLQDLFERCDYWLVRHTIISVLVESDRPQILLDTARKALESENPMTRQLGIAALGKLIQTSEKNSALDLLEELTEAQSWYTRSRVAAILAKSDEPKAKELLALLQNDEDYRVVAAALEQQNVSPRPDGQD